MLYSEIFFKIKEMSCNIILYELWFIFYKAHQNREKLQLPITLSVYNIHIYSERVKVKFSKTNNT